METIGPYTVSALADPDVGKGTFYVLVQAESGGPAPADTRVRIWTQPDDGRLAEAAHLAERQQTRYGERYVAEVPVDARGPWQVRLVIEGSGGVGETSFSVEVTPAGLGWRATLGCLLPFIILGFLWLRGVRRQRA